MTDTLEEIPEVFGDDELPTWDQESKLEASGPRRETVSGFETMVKAICFGGAGMVLLGTDPCLHHFGTSPTIVDERITQPLVFMGSIDPDVGEAPYSRTLTLPVAEQAKEVMAALALNKKQLAEILKVSRPTLYSWLDGSEPNPQNTAQLMTLLRLMTTAGVGCPEPLNARFVRYPLGNDGQALLDLLCADTWDEERIAHMLADAKRFTAQLESRLRNREDRLRQFGYEEPSEEDRAANLDENLAVLDLDEG